MITFAFRSDRLSTAPFRDAQTITLIVSWNDAAESRDSVSLAMFVNHIANLVHLAAFFHSFSSNLFTVLNSSYLTRVHGTKLLSPESSINTFEKICFNTTSICLSFNACH
jgi:hypothetical protein